MNESLKNHQRKTQKIKLLNLQYAIVPTARPKQQTTKIIWSFCSQYDGGIFIIAFGHSHLGMGGATNPGFSHRTPTQMPHHLPVFATPVPRSIPGCACDMICTRNVSNLMKIWRETAKRPGTKFELPLPLKQTASHLQFQGSTRTRVDQLLLLGDKLIPPWIGNPYSFSQWTLKKSLNFIFPTKYVIQLTN